SDRHRCPVFTDRGFFVSGFIAYIVRRLLTALITLVGVIAVVVLMVQALPGDPARVIAGLQATPEQVEKIRHTMGLDQPVAVQFWRYIDGLLHGNMGTSARTGGSVTSLVGAALPFTL